jgi:hypothetical protein
MVLGAGVLSPRVVADRESDQGRRSQQVFAELKWTQDGIEVLRQAGVMHAYGNPSVGGTLTDRAQQEIFLSGSTPDKLVANGYLQAGPLVWTKRGIRSMPEDMKKDLGFPSVGATFTEAHQQKLNTSVEYLVNAGTLAYQVQKTSSADAIVKDQDASRSWTWWRCCETKLARRPKDCSREKAPMTSPCSSVTTATEARMQKTFIGKQCVLWAAEVAGD